MACTLRITNMKNGKRIVIFLQSKQLPLCNVTKQSTDNPVATLPKCLQDFIRFDGRNFAFFTMSNIVSILPHHVPLQKTDALLD